MLIFFYQEQRFFGFHKGVCSAVYSEIRKHGLLMTSILEAYRSNMSENMLAEANDLRALLVGSNFRGN